MNRSIVIEKPPLWEVAWTIVGLAREILEADLSKVTPASRLIEDLGMDSLELVEFVMAVEERFGVNIPDESVTQAAAPFTLLTIAELVLRNWATGAPDRDHWKQPRPVPLQREELPFTQLGGVLKNNDRLPGPLYQEIGLNREGYAQYRRATDGMRCVLIPDADAQIGCSSIEANANQQPPHTVCLSSFLIDAEPVSNAAYARFLNSVGNVPDSISHDWCGVDSSDRRGAQLQIIQKQGRWSAVPKTERKPMILVSWYGANAYSLWANRKDWRCYRADGSVPIELADHVMDTPQGDQPQICLPSEAQWEHAARGLTTDASGNEPSVVSDEGSRVAQHARGRTYTEETLPSANVSERLGMSPFGLHHMAGNVWQWCRDWYAPRFYSRAAARLPDAQNTTQSGLRSERGGSWVGPPELTSPSYRRGRPPHARGRCLGFRCIGYPQDLHPGDVTSEG